MGSTTREVDILDREEVDAILGAINRRTPSGCRDRALIALMHGAGLRVSEALALRPKDVDLDTGAVVVQRGKGNKRRTAILDAGRAELVATWLERRRRLGITARTAPLICGISSNNLGEPLDPSQVRRMVKRRAAKAGIEKRVHPHGFRHAHAVELLQDGIPMGSIKAQLGHSRTATTSVYLDGLSPEAALAPLRERGKRMGSS